MADPLGMIWDVVFNALNAIFNPILALDPNPTNPALTVLIIAFIVSLIRIIQRRRLGAAITAMSFTIISVIMDISFIGVLAGILESLA